MAKVARLFVAPRRHAPMAEQFQVPAIANRGLEGCTHGRSGSRRQVLLVEEETLVEFGLAPGSLRENITTTGLHLDQLRSGDKLRVGDAVLLEATEACEPCHVLDAIRPGLREAMQHRRGVLCRVVEGGLIRRGDVIELLGPSNKDGGPANPAS